MKHPAATSSATTAAAASCDGPIFVVGCPRSGTTLLRRMLVVHSRIAIPEETHFIPVFFDGYGEPGSAEDVRRLVDAILSLRWIRDWNCSFDREALLGCRTFAGIVATLFETHARQEQKPRWGDKTPQYVACMPLLGRLFPDARFIHIHRDPRDSVASWVAAPFGPNNSYVAAMEWRRLVDAGRAAGRDLGPGRYLEVSYEELVRQPEPTLRGICTFLGEEFEPGMLTPVPFSGRDPIYRFWKPRTHGMPRASRSKAVEPFRAGHWRSTMAIRDRAIIESAAGQTMRELGYPIEGLARPVRFPERCFWQLHTHVVSVLVRINSYPADGVGAMARELITAAWRRVVRRASRS